MSIGAFVMKGLPMRISTTLGAKVTASASLQAGYAIIGLTVTMHRMNRLKNAVRVCMYVYLFAFCLSLLFFILFCCLFFVLF